MWQKNGHTFEMTRDMIDVTSMCRPDTSWKSTDKGGHEHRWYEETEEGELIPAKKYDHQSKYVVPSVIEIVDVPATDEYPEEVHYECKWCREVIHPGMTSDPMEVYVAGMIRYSVDGMPVSKEEFERLTKEAEENNSQLMYDPTKGEREVVFWSCDPSAETLRCVTVDEAVEDYLDEIDKEQWPTELQVEGYARLKAELDPSDALVWILENLDENYSSSDHCTEPTPKMLEAAKEFASKILDEYVVWNCEVVESRTVDVMSWVREHRPSWLSENEK